MRHIFEGLQALDLINELNTNVTPFMSEIGGVFYEKGWWVGFYIEDYTFYSDSFLGEGEALEFAKKL